MSRVIAVENVSKAYRLGVMGGGTLREDINRWWARTRGKPQLGYKIGQEATAARIGERFWALSDVSFDVEQGEVLGVIGRNGAGKSTLLKTLSQVTAPTSGLIKVRGRIASLLEVGTGFHPELTGRENIYLNGAILGMTKAEIARKFDEIVAFSEVEQFIDTPVKRYSSGMYVRLAFAVAAHLEPEILIVDEVLAVGDAAFQKKCLGKMRDVAGDGRSVLFVSHNMTAVSQMCTRCLLFEAGQLSSQGSPTEVVRHYLASPRANGPGIDQYRRQHAEGTVRITAAKMTLGEYISDKFFFGDTPQILIEADVSTGLPVGVELILRDCQAHAVAFAPSGLAGGNTFLVRPGRVTFIAQLPPLKLAEGEYSLDIILAEPGRRTFDCLESALSFSILRTRISEANWSFSQRRGQGCVLWDVSYEVASGTAALGDLM